MPTSEICNIDELKSKAREIASSQFRKGNNCAKSIAVAMDGVIPGYNVSENLLRKAGRYAGGGHKGMCGALSGGLLVIDSAIKSGSAPDTSEQAKAEYIESFRQRFGNTQCKMIIKRKFGGIDWGSCRKITSEAAGILAEIILKYVNTSEISG